MHMNKLSLGAATVLAALLAVESGCRKSQDGVSAGTTMETYLGDLTNVVLFSRSPLGKSLLSSSYDRSGGNNDWAQIVSSNRNGEPILFELKGPGLVHRLWMTGIPDKQKLFFYFDGEENARIKTTIEGFFGREAPFLPPLCDHVSGGYYCYFPLPFKKSLCVTLPKTEGSISERPYYQANYELYDRESAVISFPKVIDDGIRKTSEDVRHSWNNLSNATHQAVSLCKPGYCGNLPAGGSVELMRHQGTGVLSTFTIKVLQPPGMSALKWAALKRQLLLKIYWEGMSTPSVCVPLGDFSCNPLRQGEFYSMPLAVTQNGMVCRFPMYFGKSARVILVSSASFPVNVESSFDVQPPLPSIEKNYFHATWNASSSPQQPHRILSASGKGHYVGCNLLAIGMDGSWNILEGDDMIYVDGSTLPAFHGTGLEDHFNGGWYYFGLFNLPFSGLIEKAPIRTTQYRFQMVDSVPFNKNILVNIEFGSDSMANNRTRGYMSSVAYWYQNKPQSAENTRQNLSTTIPDDPLEPTAIMSALFEMERSRKYDHAERLCLEYIEKYPQSSFNEMLKLRIAAYGEKQGHTNAVELYRQITAKSPAEDVRKAASDLIWIHENPSNALLITTFNGTGSLYLDGQLVAQGDNPLNIVVKRLTIAPGKHTLAAEYTRLRPFEWLSVQLRFARQTVDTDKTWIVRENKPSDWPNIDENEKAWEPALEAKGCPPYMSFWQFYPNAIVECQAVNFIAMAAKWSREGKTVFFGKKFVVE